MSVLNDVLVLGEELTEPHTHSERVRTGWTKQRNAVYTTVQTSQPGLISQLYAAATEPFTSGGMGATSRAKPKSKPPLAIEALSAYVDVCSGALRWVTELGIEPRNNVEENVRALLAAAVTLDAEMLAVLRHSMRSWRRWCSVMAGWEHSVYRPRTSCPKCHTANTLRVNVDIQAGGIGYCVECQASWEGPDLVEMAEQIRLSHAA